MGDVKRLPGAESQREKIDRIKSQMDDIIEGQALVAAMRKMEYDSYRKEGFTAEQALELVKAKVKDQR